MLRILLCGEGPTDCGCQDYETHEWNDGPIQVIIRKICRQNNIDCFILTVHKNDVRQVAFIGNYRNLEGHAVKALKLARMAAEKGMNTAICYIDEDNRGYQIHYRNIENGFRVIDNVIGIPLVVQRMIESWMLADERAFLQLYRHHPDNPILPRRPETIWGIEGDYNTNHPKNLISLVLHQFHEQPSRDVYVSLAQHIHIDTLREKCPVSFGDFIDNVLNANQKVNGL